MGDIVEEKEDHNHDHDHDDDRPFTPSERMEIREIIEKQKRADWFWSTARVWVTWIAALVASFYAIGEFLSRFIRIKLGSD